MMPTPSMTSVEDIYVGQGYLPLQQTGPVFDSHIEYEITNDSLAIRGRNPQLRGMWPHACLAVLNVMLLTSLVLTTGLRYNRFLLFTFVFQIVLQLGQFLHVVFQPSTRELIIPWEQIEKIERRTDLSRKPALLIVCPQARLVLDPEVGIEDFLARLPAVAQQKLVEPTKSVS